MRLAISLDVKPASTPDDAIKAVDAAITRYCRSHGYPTISPWAEQKEHRGIVNVGAVAAGTFRLIEDEANPTAIADDIMGRLANLFIADMADRDGVRAMIAEAIRQDRKIAAKIVPDDGF